MAVCGTSLDVGRHTALEECQEAVPISSAGHHGSAGCIYGPRWYTCACGAQQVTARINVSAFPAVTKRCIQGSITCMQRVVLRRESATIYLRHSIIRGHMPKTMKARLTQPLVRENGSHRPATWDEAMDRVAKAFRKSIDKKDPRDFGMFSCSKTTNELNYAAQKFVRTIMGTNNIDSCNRT